MDNWYFLDVVNQRGESSYTNTGAWAYFIDRWRSRNGVTATITNDAVTLSMSNDSSIDQILPYKYTELANHSITLSLLDTDGNLYTGTSNLPSSTPTATTDFITISINQIGNFYFGYNTSLKGCYIHLACNQDNAPAISPVAFKLEFGDTQTLAVKNSDNKWIMKDAIPNKAQTLYECSRYLQSVIVPARISTFNTSNGKLDYTCKLNPPMRTTPSFVGNISNYIKIANRNGVSAWSSNNSGTFTSAFSFATYWECRYVGFSYVVDSSDKENVGTYRIIVGNDEYPNPLVSAEL